MTYIAKRPRMRRGRPQPSGLSGIFDVLVSTFGQPSQESQCVDQGNQIAAPLDAKIDDIAKNWNPTGFYSSGDIRDIVGATMKVVVQSQAAINQAAQEPSASQDSITRATDDLARAGSRSIDYLQAANDADQQGLRVINAAGLKRWVTDTLASASSAIVTAAAIGCIRPWWVDALALFQSAFDLAWVVVKRVTGSALAIGETALKIVDDLPQIYDIVKWGALAYGVYWLWNEMKSRKAGHSVL